MGEIHFIDMFMESFTLWILLGCSILAFTVGFERWWFFRKNKLDQKLIVDLLNKIDSVPRGAAKEDYLKIIEGLKGPVSDLVRSAITNKDRSKVELDELLTAARMEQRLVLEKYLGILGTLGNTAPFIGLFGTVVGIIKAFHDLAMSGSGGPAVVAAGISEALVATAAGLLVAIPSVVIFNYFMKKVKESSVVMEVTAIRLLVVLHGSR